MDFEQLSMLGEQAGIPSNTISEWYRQYGKDPAVQGKKPEEIIQAMQLAQRMAATGKFEMPKADQSVTVTGQRPRLPTTVNPYAGTSQERANPDTPNAAAISQFDPAAMRAAQEEFNRRYAAGAPYRAASDALAGFGLGSSKGLTTRHNEELQKKYYDKLQDETIGFQKRLQEQATAGEQALTSAQAREVGAGEFTAAQRKKQQELDVGQLNVDTQKRLNDPKSLETAGAKSLLLSQIAAIPTANRAEVAAIVNDPNVTATQLMPIMAQYAPAAHKAYLDQIGAGKTMAEAEQARGQAAQAYGLAGQARASAGKITEEARTARTSANLYDTITKGGTQAPSDMNFSVSGSTPSLEPSPYKTGSQGAGAKEEAVGRDLSQVSNKYALESLTGNLARSSHLSQLAGKASPTGSVANWVANLTPGESERVRAQIYQLADGKMAYGTAAGTPSIKDKDAEVARIMKLSPRAFQTELMSFNEQVVRQEARQKAYESHMQRTGNPAGFDDTMIKGATYLFNPLTGESGLVAPGKVKDYKDKGFKTLEDLAKK